MKGTLAVAGRPEADDLINTDAFALLMGMLLDQQVPMERAFSAPYDLKDRLGGQLEVAEVADMDPDRLSSLFAERPALHRFPGSMAGRTQEMARQIVDRFDGRAEQVWEGAADGKQLLANLRSLPGFGDQKARIFVALLAKRVGVTPPGWEDAAGLYGESGWHSVADIDGPESLAKVRDYKKSVKAEAKAKAGKAG